MARPDIAEKFRNPERVGTLLVLDPRQLARLEAMCNPLVVTHQTTELQTTYALGQQSVLTMLRTGFTSG